MRFKEEKEEKKERKSFRLFLFQVHRHVDSRTFENENGRGKDTVLGLLKANGAVIFKAYAKSAPP